MNTLLLNRENTDLCLNTSGNIALATDPYSVAQDVASAIRLFLGECWYDTAKGIPYFQEILGKNASVQIMKEQFVRAALTVPEVTSAVCYLSAIKGRKVTGQVQFTYSSLTSSSSGSAIPGSSARGTVIFVGDNGGIVAFVGDNGGLVIFSEPN